MRTGCRIQAIGENNGDKLWNYPKSCNRSENRPLIYPKDRRTGKSVTQIVPKGIILGHELIHGYRSMNGEASDNDCKTTYTYKDSNGDTYKTVEKTEELETVGIIGTYKYTENKLRKEHGYNKRIEY